MKKVFVEPVLYEEAALATLTQVLISPDPVVTNVTCHYVWGRGMVCS